MKVKVEFNDIIDQLIDKHSTSMAGTCSLIDWDAVYSDLLDEGYSGADASLLLDEYMEVRGAV